MFNRQTTSSDSTDASAYSRRRAAADSVWAAQDWLRRGVSTAFNSILEVVGWPFERVAYATRTKLIWPLEDRVETAGAPVRALSFAAVVVLAAGAGVAGLVWAAPDKPHDTTAAEVAVTLAPPPVEPKVAAAEKPEPTLHGAAPVFKPAKPEPGSTEVDPAKAIVKSTPADPAAEPSSSASSEATAASASAPAAQSSTVDGRPAGPAALSVARDFAGAFVVYETGGSDGDVRKAFGETATPALSKALLRRPPRLPANVKVPKAKVVNVVPAPSHGDVYPVSVSLLRVGLTSELRLEMEQRKGDGWRVTNVLG
jgi:hypothetical protein